MTIPKRAGLLAAALAAVLLAACSSGQTATSHPVTSSAGISAPTPPALPSVTIPTFPTATPSPTQTAGQIGGGFASYPDGLKVQVPFAVRFTPSQTAAGLQPGQTGVLVTVSITNGTASSFDLAAAQVKLTAGAAGNQAGSIFDSANGVEAGFSGSVLPGHSQTAKFAFSVAPSDLSNVVVEVTPDFNHNSTSFEGAVR